MTQGKRNLCLILAALLCVSLLSAVYAAEGDAETPPAAAETPIPEEDVFRIDGSGTNAESSGSDTDAGEGKTEPTPTPEPTPEPMATPAPSITASGTCGAALTWQIEDGVLLIYGTGDMTSYANASAAPWYGEEFTTLVVREGVTSVGSSAFRDCAALMEASLPKSLARIGTYAFSGCGRLANIMIDPENGSYTAAGCAVFDRSMTELVLVTAAVSGTYVIPASVTRIAAAAFSGCTGLRRMEIPHTVTEIGSYAFSGCTGLADVYVFGRSVKLGTSGTTLGVSGTTIHGFADSTAKTYASKYMLSFSALPGGACGESVMWTIMDGVLVVFGTGGMADYTESDAAPWREEGFTSIVVRQGVTTVGDRAFEGLGDVTSVTLPAGLARIGARALGACTRLTGVMIPASVTSLASDAFAGCAALADVTVDPGSAAYTSADGVVFNRSMTELVLGVPSLSGMYVIPAGVARIDDYAFSGCAGLTAVYVQNAATAFGDLGGALGPSASVTIRAPAGSTAQAYAEKWGYAFSAFPSGVGVAVSADGTRVTLTGTGALPAAALEGLASGVTVAIDSRMTAISAEAAQALRQAETVLVTPHALADGSDDYSSVMRSLRARTGLEELRMLGDIRGDDRFDALDMSALVAYLLTPDAERAEDTAAYDINGSGAVDVLDLIRLSQFISGVIDGLSG